MKSLIAGTAILRIYKFAGAGITKLFSLAFRYTVAIVRAWRNP